MNRYEKPLIIIGGFLYPIYALPWAIKYVIKNEWIGYILFAWLASILAYSMIPYDTYDLTRHYESFNALRYLEFHDIWSFGQPTKRFFYMYLWAIGHLGFPKETSIAIVAFIVYILYFLAMKDLLYRDTKPSKRIIVLSLFLIILQIRFLDSIDGMRNILAFAIFLYASVRFIYFGNKIRFIILSILAIAIHVAVMPLFFIFIFSNLFNLKFIGRLFFIISIFVLISGIGNYLFFGMIHLLEPFLRAHGLYFSTYMDPNGFWGANYYSSRNFKTLLLEKVFAPLPFYLGGFYLLYKRKLNNSKLENILHQLFVFVVLVSVSRTMFNRYSGFFDIFFIYVLIADFPHEVFTNFKKYFLFALLVSLLLITLGDEVKSRGVMIKSWPKLFYMPSTFIFLENVKPQDYIHREGL